MLKIGDIRHTGITVRGHDGGTDEDVIQAAKPAIDKWQTELETFLPEGAKLQIYHYVKRNSQISVYRYATVVESA